MKRVYRATPRTNDYLSIVFIALGVVVLAFHDAVPFGLPVSIFVIVAGIGCLYASRNMRYELTESGITRYDALGRVWKDFAWADVDGFRFERHVVNRDFAYNWYTLHAHGQKMDFRDLIPEWAALQEDVLRHVDPGVVSLGNSD
ncbi:MAG TPA: hypothetical protein VHE55_12600 [Fimbriimonadaceae bacterium]|nr:hypothetical protein [Fimbriimonadaceae bacterium]